MMKNLLLLCCLVLLYQTGCGQDKSVPSVTPMEMKNQIGEDNVVIFDVRKPEEIDKGVVAADVVNYDFYESDFKDNVAQLDKDKTYYVYCHAGGRSAKTVKMMQELGFKMVYNVEGGITQWRADGNETIPIKP